MAIQSDGRPENPARALDCPLQILVQAAIGRCLTPRAAQTTAMEIGPGIATTNAVAVGLLLIWCFPVAATALRWNPCTLPPKRYWFVTPGEGTGYGEGKMVGAVRFELTTSCTRNKRATRLRYAPTQGGKVPADRVKSNDEFQGSQDLTCPAVAKHVLKTGIYVVCPRGGIGRRARFRF